MAEPVPTCTVSWATVGDRPALLPLLDSAERARLARLRAPAHRQAYVVAHALVRLLLAPHVGVAPDALRFVGRCKRCHRTDHGKPQLAGASGGVAPISFSLAHAAGRVAVAVSDGTAVGVDVEPAALPEHRLDGLAVEALSAKERSTYDALPSSLRSRALAMWWTRKEAALKATGDGLTVAPSLLTVSPPDEPAAMLGWPVDVLVSLRELAAPPGYVGCVAVLGAARFDLMENDADPLLSGNS